MTERSSTSTHFDAMFLTWRETDDLCSRGFLSLAIMPLIQHSLDLVDSRLIDARLLYSPPTIVLVCIVR